MISTSRSANNWEGRERLKIADLPKRTLAETIINLMQNTYIPYSLVVTNTLLWPHQWSSLHLGGMKTAS